MTIEEAQAGFMADLQAVLNKWTAEIEPTYEGDLNITVFSPMAGVAWDEAKPYTSFISYGLRAEPEKR